jgi:hypothetical protein
MAKKKSSQKSNQKSRKKASSRTFWGKLKVFFWGSTFLITLGCLIWVLNLPFVGEKTSHQSHVQEHPETPPSVPLDFPKKHRESSQESVAKNAEKRLYEEQDEQELNQIISEIDLAILQSLVLTGAQPNALEHTEVSWYERQGSKYLFQILQIRLDQDQKISFLSSLKGFLKEWMDNISIKPDAKADNVWKIAWSHLPTHTLEFQNESVVESPKGSDKKALLALVIDDLGENYQVAEDILELVHGQVTYSILPHCTYTKKIVDFVCQKNLDFMLHLPMEPLKYPEINPGPGSLLVNMNDTKIRQILTNDFEEVPGALGVNNHMGSRFTAHRHGMSVVFDELKRRHLCFLDSLTNPDSVAGQLAQEMDVPFITRDIFLDNEQNIEAIVFQLKKAEHLAIQRGQAVAIGHPYPETVEALAQWMQDRDQRVMLAQIGRLINVQKAR